MKKWIAAVLIFALLLVWTACAGQEPAVAKPGEEFLRGVDVSSLRSLEESGVVYYDFDGEEKDLLEILHENGVNYIRLRVWNDPYDSQGNGYGGGNCDLENAIAMGKRAAGYQMGVLLDLHYSDFWADPGKQQAPKAWQNMTLAEKEQAVSDYTAESLQRLLDEGVLVGMVQVGNETNNGFCGETTVEGQYPLMAAAARAVRQVDPEIQIVVHYTNPEMRGYGYFAEMLKNYGVDYDIFATSYYPCWHGTLDNLKEQLQTVVEKSGKKVMIAETSWAYTAQDTDGHGNSVGTQQAAGQPWPFTEQGQAQALSDVMEAMRSFGEDGVGVFYWEPAWIAVPGNSREERSALWERYGSGWASSFSADYDPDDAGKYYGGSACDNQALFDAHGHPLEALKVFGAMAENHDQ